VLEPPKVANDFPVIGSYSPPPVKFPLEIFALDSIPKLVKTHLTLRDGHSRPTILIVLPRPY
jgi:hypothetical protein